MGARRSRGLGGGACLGALLVLGGVATAGDGAGKRAEPVSCAMRPGAHRLDVRLRERREVFDVATIAPELADEIGRDRIVDEEPPRARLERRIDEIAVIDETPTNLFEVPSLDLELDFDEDDDEDSVRSCGPPPTVTQTDLVRVRLGRHAQLARLILDLRYGRLEPGFSDEGDAGSEIELDVRIGEGDAGVKMTRGPDAVAIARSPTGSGPVTVNLNAEEPAPDSDLELGRRTHLLLDTGGGDDTVSSTGGVSSLETEELLIVAGQGADTVTGGAGTDVVLPGPGSDRVSLGAGTDGAFLQAGASDRVDCGPGRDLVVYIRDVHILRSCELAYSLRDLAEGVDVEKLARRPQLLMGLARSRR